MATPIERIAQTAYDAHRAALTGYLPPWEDLSKQEQQAWKAAASAVAGQTGGTIPEPRPGKSLVIQVGNQRHTFSSDFTVGRDGSLAIDDDFASGQHARFQTVHGLWYVEDLGSTNGTVLNGLRVLTSQLLKKRDKIKIGHTVMTVVSALPTLLLGHEFVGARGVPSAGLAYRSGLRRGLRHDGRRLDA